MTSPGFLVRRPVAARAAAVYAAVDRHGAAKVCRLTQAFYTTARQLDDRVAVETPFIRYVRA